MVGGLLGYAARPSSRGKARGLDSDAVDSGAAHSGGFLLTTVGLGFVAFGTFATVPIAIRRM
jgi:hypothetical protein